MVKIVSRMSEEAGRVFRLQQILELASFGVVGKTADGAVTEVADNLDDLIDQTDNLFVGMIDTMEEFGNKAMIAHNESVEMLIEIDMLQDRLASLIGDISYDDALDHATRDLMECFCSSGSADVTADGQLVFDQRITLSREDIKPMLREAIVRWVEQKLSK
jgi:hypothetical protein